MKRVNFVNLDFNFSYKAHYHEEHQVVKSIWISLHFAKTYTLKTQYFWILT